MSSNLQFIKEVKGVNVSNLEIPDCFSADYDIYKVVLQNINGANNDLYTRVINDSGTEISSGTKYHYANHEINDTGSFGSNKNVDFNEFRGVGFQSHSGSGTVAYFYNPYVSSSYTYVTSQTASLYSSATAMRAGKSIGVYKNADTIAGFKIHAVSNVFYWIKVQVYGVK